MRKPFSRRPGLVHRSPFVLRPSDFVLLRIEPLEDRRMLSVFAVNSLADVVADDGLITLREALEAANTNTAVYDAPAGSATEADLIIIFAHDPANPANSRITLGGTQLEILDDVDIYGPGPDSLAIDANGQSRVLYVAGGVEASLWGMTITGGSAWDVSPDDNTDDDGGGIYNAGNLTLTNLAIWGNTASGPGGGAHNRQGTLAVVSSIIWGNSAVDDGGAINSNAGTVTIVSSTISRNSASSGGAIDSSDGTLSVTNSTISGNSAVRNGGGIYSFRDALTVTSSVVVVNSAGELGGGIKSSSDTTITNSTIVGNSAGSGGGISGSSGNVVLTNSVLTFNTASSGPNIAGALLSGTGFNLIGVDPGFVRNPNDGGDGWGDNSVTTDVDESANDDYGDLHLTEHSPAVDMGSDALVPAGVTSDPDGNPRIANARVDLGAYEFQDPLPTGRETASTTVTTPADTLNYYDGLVSLREALLYVGQDGLGAEVTFAPAMNGQTIALDGVSLFLDRAVRIDASPLESLAIDAAGRSGVIMILTPEQIELTGLMISGGSMAGIAAVDTKLVITDSTISGNSSPRDGGGIYIHGGTLEIRGSTITGNAASRSGGGIYAPQAATTIIDSTISGNSAGEAGGGASGSGSIANSVISGNTSGGNGGGLAWGGTITDSTISGNSAVATGGGVYGSGTIIRSTISGNTAGTGGGFRNTSGPTIIIDSTFSGNVATGNSTGGGAVSNSSSGTLEIIGSTIVGNAATGADGRGGGVHNYQTGTLGKLTITNSIVVGNSSSGDGGGVYSSTSIGRHNLTVTNSTIAGNTAADYGGGMSINSDTAVLQNTIVARNESSSYPEVADLYIYSPYKLRSTSDYYLIGVWPSEYFGTPAGTHRQWGTPEAPLDPGFVRNPDDGGDGWGNNPATPDVDEGANDDYGDLRLLATSPAVNKGSNAKAVDSAGKPLTVDLDGRQRIIYTTVDLGAYEYCLVADADYSGTVDSADAHILATHWGLSAMSWGDGDFNRDRRVNATDAAILAANWGATFTPPAEQSPPAPPGVGQAVPDMGPFPRSAKDEGRRSASGIQRATREAAAIEAIVPPCASVSSVVKDDGAAEATDAAIAEAYGLSIESDVLARGRLARSHILARRR